MDQSSLNVVRSDGTVVGQFLIEPRLCEVPLRQDIVQRVVEWQLGKRRSGTHATLTKGEMEGGKKKPFKQKGTGRARAGNSVSPHWVGGGVAHGPQPRSYEKDLPKKVKKLALAVALRSRLCSGNAVVVSNLAEMTGKTREAKGLVELSGLTGKKLLLVYSQEEGSARRAFRNLDNVEVISVDGVNVFSLMRSHTIIGSPSTLESVVKRVF